MIDRLTGFKIQMQDYLIAMNNLLSTPSMKLLKTGKWTPRNFQTLRNKNKPATFSLVVLTFRCAFVTFCNTIAFIFPVALNFTLASENVASFITSPIFCFAYTIFVIDGKITSIIFLRTARNRNVNASDFFFNNLWPFCAAFCLFFIIVEALQ